MEPREKTCCFTGHRILPQSIRQPLSALLEREVGRLADAGCTGFLTGGALGFDTLAALTVLRLRETPPGIRLIVAAPYAAQAEGWREKDAALYEQIRSRADEFLCLSLSFTKDCLQNRNRFLVDRSSACIAFLRRRRSGTGSTVAYALQEGIPVVNLAERL